MSIIYQALIFFFSIYNQSKIKEMLSFSMFSFRPEKSIQLSSTVNIDSNLIGSSNRFNPMNSKLKFFGGRTESMKKRNIKYAEEDSNINKLNNTKIQNSNINNHHNYINPFDKIESHDQSNLCLNFELPK